jgi:mycofactocin system transcriptional regulator
VVARIALALFATDGFEATTMSDIADAVGVHRRTLFRYFPSKNDIVWGDFDRVLERMRSELAAGRPDDPMMTVLQRAAVASNSYPADQLPDLRIRMTLITSVPSLQAHSMLRYAAWRRVVAEFGARRLGKSPEDLAPVALGHAALGASMAAFSLWVANPRTDLEQNIRDAYALIRRGFR